MGYLSNDPTNIEKYCQKLCEENNESNSSDQDCRHWSKEENKIENRQQEGMLTEVDYENAIERIEFAEAIFSLSISSGQSSVSESQTADSMPTQLGLQGFTEAEGGDGISNKLRKLSIRFVASLPTRLVLSDPRRDVAETDLSIAAASGGGSLMFIQQNDSTQSLSHHQHTLYINESMITPPISKEIAVCMGVCKYIGLDIALSTPLACLLTSASGQHMQRVLSTLRLGSHPSTVRERMRGVPGERVCGCDLTLLELKPFRTFRQGEIVAYSQALSTTIPALKEDSSSSSTSSSDSLFPTTLYYGRVVSIGEGASGEGGLRRIGVRGGGGLTITMLTTEVYSFKSTRSGGEARAGKESITSGMGRKGDISPRNQGVMGKSPSKENHTLGKSKALAVGGGGEVEEKRVNDPVSRSELLEALGSLLSRSGIPADLDRDTLLGRIAELTSSNRRMEAELALERTHVVEARDALTRANAAFKCQVCSCSKFHFCLFVSSIHLHSFFLVSYFFPPLSLLHVFLSFSLPLYINHFLPHFSRYVALQMPPTSSLPVATRCAEYVLPNCRAINAHSAGLKFSKRFASSHPRMPEINLILFFPL